MKPTRFVNRRSRIARERLTCFCALLLVGLGTCLPTAIAQSVAVNANEAELALGFEQPPDSAKPWTWWHWMNGNVTREGIRADLKAMKQIGLGGAEIFNVSEGIPPGPARFMGKEWLNLIQYATEQAQQLGLQLCIHNCAGWSSSGGPWITPPYAMQMVVFSETHTKGPAPFDATLKQPETRLGFYRDIAVLAFPTPGDDSRRISDIRVKADYEYRYGQQPDTKAFPQNAIIPRQGVVNLSSHMDTDGHLRWDTPEGDWTILRIGYTPIGTKNHPAAAGGEGLECDKLSREALDQHWSGMMAHVLEEAGPRTGNTLVGAVIDSYEVGAQNWSPRFREDFERLRGYDPLPWLPVLQGRIIESGAASERFLWDLRRTVADLFAENYYGYFSDLCHSHALTSSIEPYDGPYECLQAGSGADIPMGEFWVGGTSESSSCKLAASIGHVHSRPIIGAESFTAAPDHGRWQNYPYTLKAVGDQEFAAGINRFVIHRYAMQPWLNKEPGMTMGQWGTHFERTVTWWKQGGAWVRYLTRCQYLLQAGRFAADVCYFAGEEAPNSAPHHPELKEQGYDYDACDTATLLHDMTVKDGSLVLPSGMRYHVLVLPDSDFMTPTLLLRLKDLVAQGATVIGPKPTQSPSLTDYPQCDTTVQQLAEEIWGPCDGQSVKEHAFGQGRVIWGRPVPEVLAGMGVTRDCEFNASGAKPKLAWIHRSVGKTELYFVSNQRPVPADVTCSFRASGSTPELWLADTGSIEPAPVWSEENGRVSLPIHFGPAGSVFVAFQKGGTTQDHLVMAAGPKTAAATGPAITIQKATYEAIDGSGGRDVTALVARMVADEQTEVSADNDSFGDPTPLHRKRLRIEYTIDGKQLTRTVEEGGTIELGGSGEAAFPPQDMLIERRNGHEVLEAFKPGTYDFKTANGPEFNRSVSELPPPIEITGPWRLRFPAHWGAPPEVRLAKLSSWSDSTNLGVRYFSGTAEYETEFELKPNPIAHDRVVRLELGQVKDLAEVSLNGHDLGVWWKPPFAADVSKFVRPGRNVLKVRVTNTWINRLIGDEQYPEDCEWDGKHLKRWPEWLLKGKRRPVPQRLTFTTWRHYTRDSKLVESGLLGPVVIRTGECVPLP